MGFRDIHGELVPLFRLSHVNIWLLHVLNHIARGWRGTQNVPLAPLLAHCRSDRHGGATISETRRYDWSALRTHQLLLLWYFLRSTFGPGLFAKTMSAGAPPERTKIGPLMNFQLERPAPDA